MTKIPNLIFHKEHRTQVIIAFQFRKKYIYVTAHEIAL